MPRIRPRPDGVTDTIYLDNATTLTLVGAPGPLPWPDGKAFEIIDNMGLAGANPVTIIAPVQGGSSITLNIPYASLTLKWGDNQFNVL